MPELPEVETVVTSLKNKITGQTVSSVVKNREKIRYEIPRDFENLLLNQKIVSVERKAKYILIKLSNDYFLTIHLGMSGKINIIHQNNYSSTKHDHVIIDLQNQYKLIYNDPRRFGIVDLIKASNIRDHKYFKNIGLEPFCKNFNAKYLKEYFSNKNKPIKQILMDNNFVVGVGNIYASESLFRAKIHPMSSPNKISEKKLEILVDAIQSVLKDAIKSGGSSLKDYRNIDGSSGYFQHKFLVYGKNDKPCSKCNNIIVKISLGNRSTFLCQHCQKHY